MSVWVSRNIGPPTSSLQGENGHVQGLLTTIERLRARNLLL